MLIQVDTKSKEPIYKQIVTEIQRLIAEGAIQEGMSLPSVRQLAGDLGVNLNTVATAYRDLGTLGLIRIRHGFGAVVIKTTLTNEEFQEELPKRMRDLVAWAKVRGFSINDLTKTFELIRNNLYEGS